MADRVESPFEGVTWVDGLALGLRGQAWPGEKREVPFDRFPVQLRDKVSPELWNLSIQSAGLYVDFKTAAPEIFARWTVNDPTTHGRDPYMALCARAGLDLYGRDGMGRWRWAGSQEPFGDPDCSGKLTRSPLDGVEREYRLYLPLMRRVHKLEIGARAPIAAVPRDTRRPVVYYGTSIVHGAGVSRPGLGHAQQMARGLDREFINLGFAGRAWCEPVVAEWLGRQPACLYIVDPVPNNSPESLAERLPKFLEILRGGDPETPVLLVGERLFGDATFMPGRGESLCRKNEVLTRVVQDARAAGMKSLYVTVRANWYGEDCEGSTDANHPNDLGAYRLAQALLPAVRPLL